MGEEDKRMSYWKRMNPQSINAKHTEYLSAQDSDDHMNEVLKIERDIFTRIVMHKIFVNTFVEPTQGPSALIILG